ncbi:MAG: ParB/RepB/Spo0J family partition protein [Hyphomonas sp.]|nr:ParB/RepB/Spo0J family partition protein [Hyphomonas sp.]
MSSKRDEINKAVMGTGAPSSTPAPSRPLATPFVARVAQAGAQGLLEENRKLKAERGAGRVVLELDPKRVRFGPIANRDERSLTTRDEAFAELKADLATNGQEFPIKVRGVEGDPAHDYEVVAGHRRLKAALELDREKDGGFKVLALLDEQAGELKSIALKMFRENKVRKDLTPYEYGRMFQKWIDAGVFRTQSEIAAATNLSQPTVSVYTAVFQLPREIHQAFGDPGQISLRWVQELSKALRAREAETLKRAKEIARLNPRPTADTVYEMLIAPGEADGGPAAQRRGSPTRSESFKLNNKVIFTLGRKEGRFAVKLGKVIDKGLQKELAEDLQEYLRGWMTRKLKGKKL